MDLTSKKAIKDLFKRHGARSVKSLGQNFLIDKAIIKKMIDSADITPEDTVLEIGPGLGAITQELAKKAKKVIAIEKGYKMVEILQETLQEFKNVEIINNDILELPESQIPLSEYKIVANLPFYLAAPIIRKFLEIKNPPKKMVLIIQKEVAQTICAKPPKMSLLAVSVQFYVHPHTYFEQEASVPKLAKQSKVGVGAEPKIVAYISKKAFWPQPKVDSAIIKIVPRQFRVPISCRFRERFFKIVKAGFSQPRKQLINNLSKGLKIEREKIKNWLLKNKIQPRFRAEALSVDDWIKLTKSFKIMRVQNNIFRSEIFKI